MFTQPTGHPVDARADWQDFQDLCAAAGIPGYRVHDLRHRFATRLWEEGVPPKVVSELMRHSSVAFTMATYQHVRAKSRSAAVDAIERMLTEGP